MLGTFHATPRLQPRGAGVLLCNPFGEEAARAHRIYRVLATQLARAGYPVLRFDFAGTGDSFGDDADATLTGWVRDVERAAEQLRSAGGAKRLVVFGLRLGATLAALATTRGELRPRHLILWDPIVAGGSYLAELQTMHETYLRDEMGTSRAAGVVARTAGREVLGSVLPAGLVAELRALDLANEPPRADQVTVIATRATPELDRLRAKIAGAPTTRWLDITASAAWNNDAALNSQTVPMDILQAVIARIEEVTP